MLMMPLHKDQKGAAFVEFAIVLPIVVIIVLGIIDFALLFYNKQVLTNASRELARFAIVAENKANIDTQRNDIKEFCSDRLINLGGSNELTKDPDVLFNEPEDDYITARIEYEYTHLFGGFFDFIGFNGKTKLIGRTVMRSEE